MDETIERIKKETDVFSKAKLIRHLLKEKNYRVKDVAEKLGVSPAYLCHLNRLNKLKDIIIDGYYSKQVNISHLFLISRIKDEKKMYEAYERILSENLTIKQTEEMIRDVVYNIKDKGEYVRNSEKIDLIKKIENKFLGIKADINQSRIKTKLTLEFDGNLEETSKQIKEVAKKLTD